ncbi:MAG: nuclear transport factor 2 family protein [Pseudomonadota bacterium]
MSTLSTEQALQSLLDRQAILDLLGAYFNAADRHDHDKMRSLYHEDAVDDHGAFFKGLAMDFVDQLPEIQAPMEILHHNMTTTNIKLAGDYAEGEIYVLAYHKVQGETGSFDLLIGGRYFDKYEKRDGIWKFAHKAVVADWATVTDPSAVDLSHPLLDGSYIGQRDESDPSYDFFTLFARGQR